MPRKPIFIGALLVALVAGLLFGRFTASSSSESHEGHSHELTPSTAPDQPAFWTCSMHPQIQQPGPGQCPICGMDLIPLANNDSGAGDNPRLLAMSKSAVALAEIQTTKVERRFPETSVRLVGKLDYDETRMRSLTARFPARIDRLFVNYTGVTVTTGDHLALVYSPELLTAQRELLTSHASNPDGPITKIAREKLRLWDLLPEQIDQIIASGIAAEGFELRSPIGGIVVMKNVKEGDYVKTGDPLFRIADLTKLWLHLQAFESDLAKLRYGQAVEFTVDAWPGETFTGRIAFIAPDVDARTRTVPIRVNVSNTDHRLKPGMFVRGTVRVRLAQNNQIYAPELKGKWISPMHPEVIKNGPGSCDVCGMDLVPAETLGYLSTPTGDAPLIVPASAVLLTGKRAVVYVKVPHSDKTAFEGREVILGAKIDGGYIVASGLKVGEEVVTHGAFKIDSSLQILAKPSMMSASTDEPVADESRPAVIAINLEISRAILPAYLDLQTALTQDDLKAAQAAIKAIMAETGHKGALPDRLHTMLDADNLEALRYPHFVQLSEALIATIKTHPQKFDRVVVRMNCPMADDDRGADWLQTGEDVRNPYFGESMYRCGDVVETLP